MLSMAMEFIFWSQINATAIGKAGKNPFFRRGLICALMQQGSMDKAAPLHTRVPDLKYVHCYSMYAFKLHQGSSLFIKKGRAVHNVL